MSRMTNAFLCVVSRLMTHSGVDDTLIMEVEHCSKEFLSSVLELDVRCRGHTLNVQQKNKNGRDGKAGEAWVFKPNYMSLLNMPHQMRQTGPPHLLHDGGDRGEKLLLTPFICALVEPTEKNPSVRELLQSEMFDTVTPMMFQNQGPPLRDGPPNLDTPMLAVNFGDKLCTFNLG